MELHMRAIQLALALIASFFTLFPVASQAGSFSTGIGTRWINAQPDFSTYLDIAGRNNMNNVRVVVSWRWIAEKKPPTTADAENPNWSGYRFGPLDNTLRTIASKGMRPLLVIHDAPDWAEAPGRPANIKAGTWKPDPAAFAEFAHAVTLRYRGDNVDSKRSPTALPKADEIQIWNEPNLPLFLNPVWENKKPFSAQWYRSMLASAYPSVKRANPAAKVVMASTAPIGYSKIDGIAHTPQAFIRTVLCLNKNLNKICSIKSSADVVGHHPYPIGAPKDSPTDSQNVSINQLPKLRKIYKAAYTQGTFNNSNPPLWVTEFGYRSKPYATVNPVSESIQARWTAQSMMIMHDANVKRFYWYLLRELSTVAYPQELGAGLLRSNGSPKPVMQAVHFPVVAKASGSSTLSVWVNPPSSGQMKLLAYKKGRWQTVNTRTVSKQFAVRIKISKLKVERVRATINGVVSYTWKL